MREGIRLQQYEIYNKTRYNHFQKQVIAFTSQLIINLIMYKEQKDLNL